MCGIVGFSGKENFNKDKINLLMVWNSFERGKDSTGIYTPKNQIQKEVKVATEFLNNIPFEEDNFLIAHVRAKTVGANIAKNAHPFKEDNVILCHNGTLRNHYGLLRKYDLKYQDFDVDSHIICGIMAKEKNFKVLSEIEGAAAMLITDTNNPSIMYVFRNADRPLFKGTIDGGMYISSIKESLEVIGCKNVKEFKENYLYTIKDGLIQGTAKRIVNKPYSPPITTYSNNRNTPSVAQLFNMLLTFDTNNTYNNQYPTLTYMNEYKVVGFDVGTNTIIVLNDNDERLVCPSFAFARTLDCFTTNDYVKARCNIVLKADPKKIIIKKDQYCLVSNDWFNGCVEVLNLETNEYYDLAKYFVKKLTDVELKVFQTPPTPQTNINFGEGFNVPLIKPDAGEDLFPKPNSENFYNHDEEEEEDDDVVENDLEVNEEQLIGHLTQIGSSAETLIMFTQSFIPDEEMINFKSHKMQLELDLNEALECYNVTNQVN